MLTSFLGLDYLLLLHILTNQFKVKCAQYIIKFDDYNNPKWVNDHAGYYFNLSTDSLGSYERVSSIYLELYLHHTWASDLDIVI